MDCSGLGRIRDDRRVFDIILPDDFSPLYGDLFLYYYCSASKVITTSDCDRSPRSTPTLPRDLFSRHWFNRYVGGGYVEVDKQRRFMRAK